VRKLIFATALTVLAGCGDSLLHPSRPANSTSNFVSISASGSGIPFGPMNPPIAALGGSKYDGAVRPGLSADGLRALLDSAAAGGFRIIVSVPTGASKADDGTFSIKKWKAAVARYGSVNLDAYAAAGVVIGHYLVDEPNCSTCWGGSAISVGMLEQMARYSKSRWGTVPTIVRVVPSYFPTSPRYVDAAWAQWPAPYGYTPGMTAAQYRDQHVGAAKARGLGLVLGMNVLNGGDGSSGIAGASLTKWQMSAGEVDSIGRLFAAEPYACAVINWRYSPNYPRSSGMTDEHYASITAFDTREDIIAAMQAIREVAAAHAPASCRVR
jgi:hypothetical protein